MAKELVDTLLADVRTAHDFDAFVDDFVCDSSQDPIGGAAYTAGRRTDDHDRVQGTLTEQAQKLRQGTLRRQLDDLTRVWPVLQGSHGEKKRKKQGLSDQKLQGRLLEGYLIAERRGLACLLREYQDVVMRHIKHRRRQESCGQGSMLTTGEDADLEIRYEQMRVSPLLIDATQRMTYEGMRSPSPAGKNPQGFH